MSMLLLLLEVMECVLQETCTAGVHLNQGLLSCRVQHAAVHPVAAWSLFLRPGFFWLLRSRSFFWCLVTVNPTAWSLTLIAMAAHHSSAPVDAMQMSRRAAGNMVHTKNSSRQHMETCQWGGLRLWSGERGAQLGR